MIPWNLDDTACVVTAVYRASSVCIGRDGPACGTNRDLMNRIDSSCITSFPLVKPVRTLRSTLCFTLLAVSLLGADATAQQSSNARRSVRQTEQEARASWTPTRGGSPQVSRSTAPTATRQTATRQTQPTNSTQSGAQPVRRASTQSDSRQSQRVKQVDHSIHDGIPAPAPMMQPMPLDGEVTFEPLHDYGCDAMPGGMGCGCGAAVCDGGCDSCGSCSIGGCGGGCDSCCGELCGNNPWRPCMTLCVPQDGWVSFEYLAWWQDGMRLPPLITTSTDPTIAQNRAGVLGAGNPTQVLYGGNKVLTDAFDGGRLRFGVWLDKCHQWGLGAEYFQIGQETDSFRATSGGNPILARPFFNTQLGREDSELIAYPNVVSGTGGVDVSSELVGWGVHLRNLRQCNEGCNSGFFCGCPEHFCSRTEAMFGYRNLQLDESVAITESLVGINPTNNFQIRDQFDTRNQFSGVDFGWMYRRTRGYWTFDALMRLALGNTRQTVTINGNTRIDNAAPLTGGLLAQTSNIGTYKRDEFAVVPEIDLNIGYQLTDQLRLIGGYTFIYWSNVVRPGDQISRDLNTDQLPPPITPSTGALRPEFNFVTTDYWVQGLNFGAEYRW